MLFALCGEGHERGNLFHGGVVGHAVNGAAGLAAAGHAVLAAAKPVVQPGRPGSHVAVGLPSGLESRVEVQLILQLSINFCKINFLCLFWAKLRGYL